MYKDLHKGVTVNRIMYRVLSSDFFLFFFYLHFSDHRDQPKEDTVVTRTVLQHQRPICGGSLRPHAKCIFCGATFNTASAHKDQSLQYDINRFSRSRKKQKTKNKISSPRFNKCKAAKTAFNI